MSSDEVYEYKGYRIPLALMHLTGGGPANFDAVSRVHMDLLEQHVELSPEMKIVEIGCGIGRDAIPLAERLSDRGSYLGIDVHKEQIDWCVANISARHPNFRFAHFDVREDWYNPKGAKACGECRIPVLPGSVDRIILQSVFTHMVPEDTRHYLREFQWILKPDGRIFSTFFIMTDEIFAAQRPDDTLYFYEAENGFYIVDPVHPTKTVAYNHWRILSLMNEVGLKELVPPIVGCWAGPGPIRAQDIVIMALQSVD